jgi:hypothetical protein
MKNSSEKLMPIAKNRILCLRNTYQSFTAQQTRSVYDLEETWFIRIWQKSNFQFTPSIPNLVRTHQVQSYVLRKYVTTCRKKYALLFIWKRDSKLLPHQTWFVLKDLSNIHWKGYVARHKQECAMPKFWMP